MQILGEGFSPWEVVCNQLTMQRIRDLRICQVNARSLLADTRLLDLQILTEVHNIDVLCVTETWLTSRHADSAVSLKGYQPPLRFDRPSRRGGGAAVYLRHGLTALSISLSGELEAVALRLFLGNRSMLDLVCLYCPPDVDTSMFIANLEDCLTSVQGSSCRPLCLIGDFNAKHHSWWSGQSSTAEGNALASFALTSGLVQVVHGPTYGVESDHPSQLDLAFLNAPGLVKNIQALAPVADHCPTLIELALTSVRGKTSSYETWDYDSAIWLGCVSIC